MYSNLCNIPVLVDAERYQRLGIIAKEPLQLHDLLFGILVNILREVDFLLGVLKSHISRSFRFLPLPEDLRFLFLCDYSIPHFAQFFNPVCAVSGEYSVNSLLREFVHQLAQRHTEEFCQRHHVSRADCALLSG